MGNSNPAQYKLNIKELQQFQDIISSVTNLFMFCVGSDGNRITEMSGDPLETKRILGLVDENQMISVIGRVLGTSLEEQVIEDTAYPNVKIASIGVTMGTMPAFCWFICGVLDNEDGENAVLNIHTVTSEANFNKSIDLIREASSKLYSDVPSEEAKTTRSSVDNETEDIMKSYKKSQSMAEIISLLDSDDSFDVISQKIINYASKYAGITHAYMLRLITEDKVELMAQYEKDGVFSLDREFEEIPIDILHSLGDRPTVISYKTQIEPAQRRWLDIMSLSAMIVMPILYNHKPTMYLFFADTDPDKEWSIDDTKFFGDAVRVLRNIMARRLQKNSITSSYKSLEAILDNVGSAIYVRDTESGNILFANRMCKSTFMQEMRNGTLENLFEKGARSSLATSYMEVEYPEKKRWYDLNTTYIEWVDGRRVCMNSIFDVTDKKMYQQKIEQQANNDFLTGLYNRMCCERDLTRHIDEAKAAGETGAIIYLDLDDFKHINDGLGHQYGDVLLKAISNSLRRINGIENTCYRMGGDEFVIIVPHESYRNFDRIKEEIQIVFNKPWFLKGADYYCTASIGIVTFPEDGDTVQDLVKKADVAMYEAKKSGKNKISIYSKEADADSSRRLDMEKSMRFATAGGYKEFEVYFQPIVDVKKSGNPCVGAEALVRWNSSDLGFVSPGDFIPLAEYLGLINPIGNYVLEQACLALKYWNESGHPYYKVNVNLSVVQLLQNDIVETIEEIIKRTGINPKNLTLEVTESLAINDMVRMKRIISNIKKLGVKIALDDFGTGYSSLNHIREIPLDVIKVDQTFVKGLATDEFAQAFVSMIGELATALGVKICVEGIETIEQYKVLEKMNVSMIQGFYFGKPMPRSEFEEKFL
ncbi:MAG: EAL domain-containing protein [Lachnospiraceae bacterium]|nr:EAL domain-containing protein [Lachnospiraceae bacterium]